MVTKRYKVTYNLVTILFNRKVIQPNSEIMVGESFGDITWKIRQRHGYNAKNIKVEEAVDIPEEVLNTPIKELEGKTINEYVKEKES